MPGIALALVALYTYANFFERPYAGFEFSPSNGEIARVYYSSPLGDPLKTGDRIIRIGSVPWEQFQADLRQNLFEGAEPGDHIEIVVERDGQNLTIDWTYPGYTSDRFRQRLIGVWWMAYFFYFAGTATYLLVRPKDSRWRLMLGFNYLTAFWLSAGSGPSHWHVLQSAIVLRVGIWLSIANYTHFHWVFPRPLKEIPSAIWKGLYLLAGALAVAQWYQLVPGNAYLLGFILAIGGSLTLMVAHAVLRTAQRRDILLVLVGMLAAVLPSAAAIVASLFTELPYPLQGGSVLFFCILPFTYFYVLYRRQLGGLELRANRLLSSYLYIVFLTAVIIVLIPLALSRMDFPGAGMVVGTAAALLATVVTIFGFDPFRQLVERRFLNMPLPSPHLLQTYADHISTSLDSSKLVHLLQEEILPSLLIRQSALIRFDEDQPVSILYVDGVQERQLPGEEDIRAFRSETSRSTSLPYYNMADSSPFSWMRLVIPLNIGERLIGLWLLGRRDPDDYYSQTDIKVLQTLANQTAIALTNIIQAKNLRALYQTNIHRHERERYGLARDLHDEVLNQLAVMFVNFEEQLRAGTFEANYQELIERLRQTISGLRPPMLDFGLAKALEELRDDLAERGGGDAHLEISIHSNEVRFDPDLELHIFRIVQQACENALRHANASKIRIHGSLESEQIQLHVEDDGIGFETVGGLDLASLLRERHFGLAGMLERAALIGARVQIDPKPGQGTRISVYWKADQS